MQTSRISVPLTQNELRALISMAEAACRHPREELRFIFREAARRAGLLESDGDANEQPSEVESEVVV